MAKRSASARAGTAPTRGAVRNPTVLLLGLSGPAAAWAQPRRSVADLGVLPDYASCVATEVNGQGTVVGCCASAVVDFNPLGFVWKNGVMSPVGKLSMAMYGMAMAVNAGDTGNFLPRGWIKTSTTGWKGAIWMRNAKDPRRYDKIDLPRLPGGIDPAYTSSSPTALNQSGQAVGSAQNDQIGRHATFWNNDAAHTVAAPRPSGW